MTTEEAVLRLRKDPGCAKLVHDTYLDADILAAAERFERSGEWQTVISFLGPLAMKAVLDLGAGIGMASRAFARAGATRVIAVEPDSSAEIGRGAANRICSGLPVNIIDGYGESLPLPDASVEIIYARQVLHHTTDLEQTLRECARVLKRRGLLLACREHVAETPAELAAFLRSHPVHQFTGGENAFPLSRYCSAIANAGLQLSCHLRPWDSVLNLYPEVQSDDEIPALPARIMRQRYGLLGKLAAYVPGGIHLARHQLARHRPGELHSFLAIKP